MVDPGTVTQSLSSGGAAALGAGLAMGLSAIGAAMSQGSLGSALMGAIAERPELEKSALIYLVLPEFIAIMGFLIAFFLIGKVAGA